MPRRQHSGEEATVARVQHVARPEDHPSVQVAAQQSAAQGDPTSGLFVRAPCGISADGTALWRKVLFLQQGTGRQSAGGDQDVYGKRLAAVRKRQWSPPWRVSSLDTR